MPGIDRAWCGGLLVKPGDLDDLSAQLGALIDDPALRAKLAAAATARIGREFSLQASARRLEQIYESYLARANRNAAVSSPSRSRIASRRTEVIGIGGRASCGILEW